MLQTLVICLFILSIWALLKSATVFVNVWKSEAPLHWQHWGEPEFVDLYRGMFGELWPVIFGKACEKLQQDNSESHWNTFLEVANCSQDGCQRCQCSSAEEGSSPSEEGASQVNCTNIGG